MHGVDLTCIGYGVFVVNKKTWCINRKQRRPKLSKDSCYVGWKVSMEAKVDNLVVKMAKLESMVDSMVEIKVMLTQMQHFEH